MSDVVVYRKRRGVELVMLLFALGISYGAYILTDLGVSDALPAAYLPAGLIWLVLGLVAHAAVRWRIPYADPLILPSVMLLNGLGLAMIHRLDLGSSPLTSSAESQLMWTGIAVAVFAVVLFVLRDYRTLKRFPYLLFLAGMLLLLTPLLPVIGHESGGARIWIMVGKLTFQPAELAKIILAVAFASYLVDKREVLALAGRRFLGIDLPRIRDLGPILIMWLLSLAVLVFQKDLGTSLLFFGLFVAMLYLATERPSWPILGTLLFVGGAAAGYAAFGHVRVRFSAWLTPFADWDQNYQIIQAQYGLAWGGLFGTGWGLGRPNLTPVAKSDFIAAALGEEIGVVGLTAIVLVYAFFVTRALKTAVTAKEPFGKLLAAGLGFVFALQVFTIIGGVTRLLPLTGLTTPFLSQGGSSLIANWMAAGLLMIISHQVRRPEVVVASSPVASLADDRTQVIPAGRTPRHDEPAVAPATPSAHPQASPNDADDTQTLAAADEATQVVPSPDGTPTVTTPTEAATEVVALPTETSGGPR